MTIWGPKVDFKQASFGCSATLVVNRDIVSYSIPSSTFYSVPWLSNDLFLRNLLLQPPIYSFGHPLAFNGLSVANTENLQDVQTCFQADASQENLKTMPSQEGVSTNYSDRLPLPNVNLRQTETFIGAFGDFIPNSAKNLPSQSLDFVKKKIEGNAVTSFNFGTTMIQVAPKGNSSLTYKQAESPNPLFNGDGVYNIYEPIEPQQIQVSIRFAVNELLYLYLQPNSSLQNCSRGTVDSKGYPLGNLNFFG